MTLSNLLEEDYSSYPNLSQFLSQAETPAATDANEVAFVSNPVDGSYQDAPPVVPTEIPSTGTTTLEVPELDISKYYLYLGECRQVSFDYGGSEDRAHNIDMFIDIEIMVNGEQQTNKITKRIKLCKETLIREAIAKNAAMNNSAVYVESKQEEEKKSSTQRMLELAGINHPKNYVL